MDYETLRQMADSWGLLYLMILFIAVVLFAFRPWARKRYDDAAKIPLTVPNRLASGAAKQISEPAGINEL